MLMQNSLNPLSDCDGGTHTLLINKMIGNSYEVVKHVALHLDEIKRVSDFLKVAGGSVYSFNPMINTVVCADHTVFDISSAFIQELTLNKDVTFSEITGVLTSQNLIIIRVIQDSVGDHSFTWPTLIHSHGDVDLTANAISQQMFVKNVDGSFDFANPMMYPKG